jgi:hypothetical protein
MVRGEVVTGKQAPTVSDKAINCLLKIYIGIVKAYQALNIHYMSEDQLKCFKGTIKVCVELSYHAFM